MQYIKLPAGDRKVNLLQRFAKFGMLSFDEASAINCGNLKVTRSDLAYLFHDNLLSKRKIRGFKSDVIFITKKGADFVADYFDTPERHKADYSRTGLGRRVHRLYIANVMIARALQITGRLLKHQYRSERVINDSVLSVINDALAKVSLISELDFYFDRQAYTVKGKQRDGLILKRNSDGTQDEVTWLENEKTPKGEKQFHYLINFLNGIRLDKNEAVFGNQASLMRARIPMLHNTACLKSIIFYVNTSPLGAGNFEARLRSRLSDETFDYLKSSQFLRFVPYQLTDYLMHKTPAHRALSEATLVDKNFSLICS